MKKPPTKEDRLWRLKLRMGWRPKTFRTRIRPGGWITLPPGLGAKTGDLWAIESIDRTLVLRRIEPRERSGRKPPGLKPPCRLAAALTQMPAVGTDDDFARVDIQESKREVRQ